MQLSSFILLVDVAPNVLVLPIHRLLLLMLVSFAICQLLLPAPVLRNQGLGTHICVVAPHQGHGTLPRVRDLLTCVWTGRDGCRQLRGWILLN